MVVVGEKRGFWGLAGKGKKVKMAVKNGGADQSEAKRKKKWWRKKKKKNVNE